MTTNTGVRATSKGSALPREGWGVKKWPGVRMCVNVTGYTTDATTGATALLLPAHVNMSRSHRNAAHARTHAV